MDKASLFKEIQLWSKLPEGSWKNRILNCLTIYVFCKNICSSGRVTKLKPVLTNKLVLTAMVTKPRE